MGRGGWVFSQCGRWGKISVQTFSNRFLKTLIEGAVTTEAGSLFQYFTTLTKNADSLLLRWLAPWSTLKRCPLRPRRAGGRKNKFGSISKTPLNILKAVMRSQLQGMKAQSLQSLFVGEVTHASYQPCSLSLNSLLMVDVCNEVWWTGWHTIFEVRTH